MFRRNIVRFGVPVLVALVAYAAVAQAAAVITSSSGTIGKFELVEANAGGDATNLTCTDATATDYTDMPNISTTFYQNSSALRPASALVSFDAELAAAQDGLIRIVVDGAVASGTGAGMELRQSADKALSTWNFATTPLGPGLHTIKVQWKSAVAGTFCVYNISMTVHHE